MKKTQNGNNQNLPQRNTQPSAAQVPVKSGTSPVKKPVQRVNSAANPQSKRQAVQNGDSTVNNARPKAQSGEPAMQNNSRPQTQNGQTQTMHNNRQKPQSVPVKKTAVQPEKTVQKTPQKPAKLPQKKTETSPENNPEKNAAQTGKIIRILMISVAVLLLVLVGVRVYMFYKDETALLIPEVTIEAGTVRPNAEMFFSEQPSFPEFVKCNLNFDEVNIDLPQTVHFNMKIYGRNHPCTLIIQDTIAPEGTGIAQKMFACEQIPDASECVTGISDVTDVSCTWKTVPDMSEGGSFTAVALLTDGCGNETEVGVPFEVTKDDTAPVIDGTHNIEAYIGDPVIYKDKITVTDDYDENPVLEIDTSGVNPDEPGTYDVVYKATDFSGNESTVTISLKLANKPEGYIEPEVLYAAAKEILDEITEPGMTDEEVALQIVWWCRYNIRFILRTNTRSWTEAAYNAFQTRTGNCYSTAYAVKALLDVAGIENMIIERYPYQTATHFWNYVYLNGQWYHCDATWREGYDSYFFMYTTEELLDFWQGGWNGFQFKQKEFPESATESVQYRIDYKNHKIKD